MKISQMLEREDFYAINSRTLDAYFGEKSNQEAKLYIYPSLNAIVTGKPSKRVVDFLLCEYLVRGNAVKRLAAQSYVWGCMHSHGILAAKNCVVKTVENPEILIYPCNKKYRIFDFGKHVVDVVSKSGFDNSDLLHEMEFRRKESLPDFVPGLVYSDENGYRETIIDGCPLARVSEGFEKYRDEAYQLLIQYGQPQQHRVDAKEYTQKLMADIKALSEKKSGSVKQLNVAAKKLAALAASGDDVMLTFSHGDLQPGNIWVENRTRRIYIIDWESWAERSIWYDHAALYQGLRGNIQNYLEADIPVQERAVVLLEDLIFRLHEINSLPENFGMAQFCSFIDELVQWLKVGE